jgi:hypothetical protein
MREAQLTHHLQQADGAMRINIQNRAANSDPILLSEGIITVLVKVSVSCSNPSLAARPPAVGRGSKPGRDMPVS